MLVYAIDGFGRGVYAVGGIECVVAQFIYESFVCREVGRAAKFVNSKQQCRLRQLIAMESVGNVSDRTDSKNELFGAVAVDYRLPRGNNFSNRQATANKFPIGEFMAIAHNRALTFKNPRRAERYNNVCCLVKGFFANGD